MVIEQRQSRLKKLHRSAMFLRAFLDFGDLNVFNLRNNVDLLLILSYNFPRTRIGKKEATAFAGSARHCMKCARRHDGF